MLVDLGVDEEEEVGDPKEGEQDEGGSDRSLDLHRLSSVMLNFKSGHYCCLSFVHMSV